MTNPTNDEVEALRIAYRERVLAAYDKLVSDLGYAAPEIIHERLLECRYVFEHVFDLPQAASQS